MLFSIYQDTLCGARASNQDRMGYCFTRESLLMLVADGMGGHLYGEIAAHVSLQAVAACFQAQARPLLSDPPMFLDRAVRHAHREILRHQTLHGLSEAPHTTIVACVVQNGRAWWAHAGDSRLYWLRDGRLLARTRDHSKVQNLVDLGKIGADECGTHPDRNKVLNCLGSPFEPMVEPGGGVDLQSGDTLMLCSDGVWSPLSEPALLGILSDVSVLESVPRLVHRAVDEAGPMADNATALAMTWGDGASDDETMSSSDVPDGAITTTIVVGQAESGSSAEALSDDEIERTIREIREAIARTGG